MSICCCSKVLAQLVSRIVRRHGPREKQSNTLYRHSVEIPATTEINKKTDLNIALEPLEAMTPFGG
jgi:hypothetical protein